MVRWAFKDHDEDFIEAWSNSCCMTAVRAACKTAGSQDLKSRLIKEAVDERHKISDKEWTLPGDRMTTYWCHMVQYPEDILPPRQSLVDDPDDLYLPLVADPNNLYLPLGATEN